MNQLFNVFLHTIKHREILDPQESVQEPNEQYDQEYQTLQSAGEEHVYTYEHQDAGVQPQQQVKTGSRDGSEERDTQNIVVEHQQLEVVPQHAHAQQQHVPPPGTVYVHSSAPEHQQHTGHAAEIIRFSTPLRFEHSDRYRFPFHPHLEQHPEIVKTAMEGGEIHVYDTISHQEQNHQGQEPGGGQTEVIAVEMANETKAHYTNLEPVVPLSSAGNQSYYISSEPYQGAPSNFTYLQTSKEYSYASSPNHVIYKDPLLTQSTQKVSHYTTIGNPQSMYDNSVPSTAASTGGVAGGQQQVFTYNKHEPQYWAAPNLDFNVR